MYDKNAKEETVQLINNAVKVVVVVPYIAYAAIALQSKEGLIVVGLGVIFLIIPLYPRLSYGVRTRLTIEDDGR